MSLIQNANQENFEQDVLESKVPVLVNFKTNGCGPCEALVPVLEEIVTEYEGKLKVSNFFVSLDEVLENSNEVAKKYDVMGFPTLILFKDGEVSTTLLGGQSKESILNEIEAII